MEGFLFTQLIESRLKAATGEARAGGKPDDSGRGMLNGECET